MAIVSKAWVIAREIVEHGRKWTEFWTGDTGENGGPSRSPFRSDAFHFTTPGAAYECAATHRDLKDSDLWRVVPADRRLRKHA